MKTTLELPDELFSEAKAMAARRRITLKELFTKALERELKPLNLPDDRDSFVIDDAGWPVSKRSHASAPVVTEDWVQRLREQEGV